ncbi:hypothetical protein pEaSNUABM37_00348 [Erwinia phage pEa_SNUABM_37]|nr:hypothetical protein pEaSNUABM37_00348 [Erwinia phage pEa_SNUABM_37]QXO10816.1 hypothetical protein pEaSNUABM48_00348 [Erwinia phage pEa_SNUABM_48]
MTIDSTSLINEITQIAAPQRRLYHNLTAELTFDTTVLNVFRVASLNRYCDFVKAYAEEWMIDLVMNKGLFNTYVVDNQDRLMINLYIDSSVPGKAPNIKKLQMRAFPKNTTDERVKQNRSADLNQEEIGKLEMDVYQFQLVDVAMEHMRAMQTGGNYPVTSAASVLRTLLGGAGSMLDLPLEQKPVAPDVIAPDTEVVKNMICVKQGTNLCDLPGYLQHHYGLYNTQLGSFYHDRSWYVWPLYNTKRFELAKKTLTLINVPRDRFPDIETTFAIRGNSVVILLTGDSVYEDTTNRQQYNDGNGTRAIRASAVSGDEGRIVDKGQVVVQRSQSNTEIKTNDRRTGVNVVPSTTEVTDNTARVLSRTATVNGTTAQFAWQSSDPSLIFPGMPVKLLYLKDGVVVQRYGVLTAAESQYTLAQPGLMDKASLAKTALTVFISNTDDTYNTSL